MQICRYSLSILIAVFGLSELAAQGGDAPWKDKTVVVSIDSSDLEDGRRMREFGRILERAGEEEVEAIVFDIDVSESAP